MKYFLYETKNLINKKIYIGAHSTDNLENDNYLGSGKVLTLAIKNTELKIFKELFLKNFQMP